MQHMQAATGGARQPQHALGRKPRGLHITPERMGAGIARFGQTLSLAQPRFVFGMHRHAAAARLQGGSDIPFFIQQQRSGGGAEERLHARHARHLFQHPERADVVRRGAHIKRIVAVHAAARARKLVLDGGARGGRRIGVRHLEHGGDPAQHGRAAAAFEVFLVLVARLAEMHLRVDYAGQHMQPARLEHLGGVHCRQRTDGGNSPLPDRNIRFADAVRRHAHAAADQEIETIAHAALPSASSTGTSDRPPSMCTRCHNA